MSTEEVALAIIAAVDADDFGNVRAETEPMENVRGGTFFEVSARGRYFTVVVTEDIR